MAELYRVFNHRYGGPPLADDDAGRDDLKLTFQVISTTSNAGQRMRGIASTWAPWMPPDELDELVGAITSSPRRFKADTIAARLGITSELRTQLMLRTIGAIDMTAQQRSARRRETQRAAKEAKRRAAGAVPIAELRRRRATVTTPWQVDGISRATWYRRRQTETQHAA